MRTITKFVAGLGLAGILLAGCGKEEDSASRIKREHEAWANRPGLTSDYYEKAKDEIMKKWHGFGNNKLEWFFYTEDLRGDGKKQVIVFLNERQELPDKTLDFVHYYILDRALREDVMLMDEGGFADVLIKPENIQFKDIRGDGSKQIILQIKDEIGNDEVGHIPKEQLGSRAYSLKWEKVGKQPEQSDSSNTPLNQWPVGNQQTGTTAGSRKTLKSLTESYRTVIREGYGPLDVGGAVVSTIDRQNGQLEVNVSSKEAIKKFYFALMVPDNFEVKKTSVNDFKLDDEVIEETERILWQRGNSIDICADEVMQKYFGFGLEERDDRLAAAAGMHQRKIISIQSSGLGGMATFNFRIEYNSETLGDDKPIGFLWTLGNGQYRTPPGQYEAVVPFFKIDPKENLLINKK